MTGRGFSRMGVFAVALLTALAVALPPAPVVARDWNDAGSRRMHLSASDRQKLRKSIQSKHYRPGRPIDPGFGQPWPGHHSSIRNEIRKEIRKDMRRRFVGELVAGVVLGAIINVSRAGQIPGPPPRSDLCWAWSDNYRTRGYWTYCDRNDR